MKLCILFQIAGAATQTAAGLHATEASLLQMRSQVRRIFSLFYAKIMVVGDGQFYRGFGGYWVFWFLGCLSACPCQFGTNFELIE